MISWLKKLLASDVEEENDGETSHEVADPEEAIAINAMRAFQTGRPVVGEWDGTRHTPVMMRMGPIHWTGKNHGPTLFRNKLGHSHGVKRITCIRAMGSVLLYGA